jgi:hypothetical protein
MGFLITPGMTQNEMETINNGVVSLSKDFLAAGPAISPDTQLAWKDFAASWVKFRDENSGWFNRGVSGVYEQVLKWRDNLAEWRDRFIASGGKPRDVQAPAEKPIGWIGVLAGGVIVLGAVWFVMRKEKRDVDPSRA